MSPEDVGVRVLIEAVQYLWVILVGFGYWIWKNTIARLTSVEQTLKDREAILHKFDKDIDLTSQKLESHSVKLDAHVSNVEDSLKSISDKQDKMLNEVVNLKVEMSAFKGQHHV